MPSLQVCGHIELDVPGEQEGKERKERNLDSTNISCCTVLKCSRVQQCCSHVILLGGPVAIEGSKHGRNRGVLQRQFQHVRSLGSGKEAYIFVPM